MIPSVANNVAPNFDDVTLCKHNTAEEVLQLKLWIII